MVDWFFDALNNFVTFMNGTSLVEFLALMVVIEIGIMALVLVHEVGHAVAARTRGLAVTIIHVGGEPLVTFSVGSTRVELGWTLFKVNDRGGYASSEGSDVTPNDVLIVVAAGPAASLAAGVACAWAVTALESHTLLSVAAGWLAIKGLFDGVSNLVPFGEGEGMSDGRRIALAWQVRRAGISFVDGPDPAVEPARQAVLHPGDPHQATSVAPPPSRG